MTRPAQTIGMDVHRPISTASGVAGQRDADGNQDKPSEESGASGPPAAVVPDVRGLVFASAVHRLWRAGIDFDLVFARESHDPRWTVIEVDPPAGSDTPSSGKINLVLSLHHIGGVGVIGTVVCKPETDELDDPYCLGKLLKY